EAGFDPQGRTSEDIRLTPVESRVFKLPKVVQIKTKRPKNIADVSTQPWRVLSSCFSSHDLGVTG
nr:replicative DNA helicase [Escherichia coli]